MFYIMNTNLVITTVGPKMQIICVDSTWTSQWEMAKSVLYRIDTSPMTAKKLSEVNSPLISHTCAKFDANFSMGASVQMG